MLKYTVASAVLIFGLAALIPVAHAAPRNDDCVNCSPVKQYNNEDAVRAPRENNSAPAVESNTTPPATESIDYRPNSGGECANCPPPKKYDSIEVIKHTQDVDQSRVIDTNAVVQTRPRVREINKLIIHENETRNVGVIQHNHRIIEKETRYVRRAPARVYQYAAPAYQVVRVETVLVPVAPQSNCGCPCTCGGYGQGSGGALYAIGQAIGGRGERYTYVPVAVPNGYGYR
jgi:hypothetical protein